MRSLVRSVILCAGLVLAAAAAPAATYTVDSTADFGMGTLRQAILDANANVNVVDTIEFDIAGPPYTITPMSQLPQITDPVTIDGYTQTGATPNTAPIGTNAVLLIEIDGSMAGAAHGLLIEHLTNLGAGTTIRGLVINGFNTNLYGAIRINDDGNNVIEGNFIGTDPSGLMAKPNYDGIATEFFAEANRIGGTTPAARNLISGNSNRGLVLDTDDNTIEGNLIGTDRTGLAPLGNAAGIVLFNFAHDNVIGGGNSFLSPAANTIAGNLNSGISVLTGSTGHDIRSNKIGLGADGLTPIGNGPGSAILLSANDTTIVANTIAGNNGGIFIGVGVSNTVIQSNVIGFPQLGNSGAGISVIGASNNLIGGLTPDLGNLIAGNGGVGVDIAGFMGGGSGNAILQNSIFDNGQLGIQLSLGGNNDQPAPVLTSASNASIDGSLTAAPTTAYRLEFFASRACDPSGGGEGEEFLTSVIGGTDGAGVLNFSVPSGATPGRPFITATATDPLDNTSQFSNCAHNPAAIVAPAPALDGVGIAWAVLVLTAIGGWSAVRQRRAVEPE
jgi:hypothetical protein